MTIAQIIAAYNALSRTDAARTVSSVSIETGVPAADVERLVAFIKSSHFFLFELTDAGLLAKLDIRRSAKGVYSHVHTSHDADWFYKDGRVVEKFSEGSAYELVLTYARQLAAEAKADGAIFYPLRGTPAINVLAPYLSEWLAMEPA